MKSRGYALTAHWAYKPARTFRGIATCILVIVRFDVEAFDIADTIAEFEGYFGLFGSGGKLLQVVITRAECSMSHGEIGIEFDGLLQWRYGSGVVSAAEHDFASSAVGLKSVERGGCGAIDGRVEFLDGAEGFAEFLTEVDGGVVEGLEDFCFAFGADLLLGEDVAVGAVHGFEADDVGVVEAGDGAFEDGGALRAQADFAGNFGSDVCVGGLAHEAESLLDALFGDDAEEGRLFELDGEGLFESVVEDGVAGGVGEVGEDDGVGLGEFGGVGGAVIKEAGDSEEGDQGGAGDHRQRAAFFG